MNKRKAYKDKGIKRCGKCHGTENLYVNTYTKYGKPQYMCRACNTERMKEYRQTKRGKEVILENIRKYEKKNPLRRKAWTAAQCIPKQPCEVCGTNKNIHRHHPNINEPLRVVFLCAADHKAAHKKQN